ncbi:RelA/SpoT family protein [Candidatus Gracilibacteria bacterium]|nr:RelA/SpoT family protein [Candidatus Gracilibacteria bacterium]
MDIKEIDSFFDYKPIYDEDPQFIVDDIIYVASKYLAIEKLELIQKAYDFAKSAHAGEKRLSGEPYLIHPLKATQFLMEIKPDISSIQACIMHDIIEDTSISYEEIKEEFGNEVADLCEGLVKVSKIKYKGEDRHLETLKKTFLAMAKDLRVIFIKLADRIHNIQTLQYHPNIEKRIKIAEETLKIYVPVAKRLGLYHYQLYLENGSFMVLQPDEFDRILNYLKKYFGEGEKYTERGIKLITNMLKKEGISDFEVKGRIKSPYRVYEKLEKKYNTSDLSSVMDFIAYRVITKSVGDCYMVLGIIHKNYTPLIKKIKDYIAVPKFNGYKSIHTTILGMFRFPVEIQIRTYEMDDVAEFGVAAHFAYSEKNASVSVSQQQSQWIKRLQRIVDAYKSSDEKELFKDELNIEVLQKGIFIYTPGGDVIELPGGATVLDFAFNVHSEIGLKFKNALVNREIKPISYVPNNGDIIHINVFKNKYSANKHWLEFLHTPTAKTQLMRYLRSQDKKERLDKSIHDFNKILKDFGLANYDSDKDKIVKFFDRHEIERRLLLAFEKKDSYGNIIKVVYPEVFASRERSRTQKNKIEKHETKKPDYIPVVVDNNKFINCTICAECKPNIGDKIISKSSKYGIKIHTMNCKALRTVSFVNLLEAHWDGEKAQEYNFLLKIKMLDKYMGILDIMSAYSQLNFPISQMTTKNSEDGTSILIIQSIISNPAKIGYLLKDLKNYTGSIDILRKKIE